MNILLRSINLLYYDVAWIYDGILITSIFCFSPLSIKTAAINSFCKWSPVLKRNYKLLANKRNLPFFYPILQFAYRRPDTCTNYSLSIPVYDKNINFNV